MASWWTYVQAVVYFALLFFIVPIRIHNPDKVELQFEEYLKKFNKSYDGDVYEKRLQAFKNSLEVIEALNSNQTNTSARYGLTKFSDLLPEEFIHNHLQTNMSQRLFFHNSDKKHIDRRSIFPNKVDWRLKNAVTRPHNQGNCGACWAYSVVETIESMNFIKTGHLEDLSVQEIIDCAGNNNQGCDGGDICSLLSWLKDTNFILHKKDVYPGISSRCTTNSSDGIQVEDFICENLVGIEPIILKLLAENGPVAVAVNGKTWQNYIGGVIQYHCDGDPWSLNHAVQIVGYDLTADIPYYIVRNSWGEDFGDGGYLYIAVGQNMCGLANEVSALTLL